MSEFPRTARILLFLAAAWCAGGVVLSPSVGFHQREAMFFAWPNALAFGPSFSADDWLHALDWQAFDGMSRARFLSNLFDALGAKWAYMAAGTPFPMLSPVPLLLLFGAPWMCAVLAKRLGAGPGGPAFAAAAALCSEGVLSQAAMQWHSGKALATLAALSCGVLATGSRTWRTRALLSAAVFAGALSDEGFWPALAGVAIACGAGARERGAAGGWGTAAAGIAGAGAAALCALVWLPAAAGALSMPAIDVPGTVSSMSRDPGYPLTAAFARDGALETLVLFWSHWLPFYEVGAWGTLDPRAWFPEAKRIAEWGWTLPLDPRGLPSWVGPSWLFGGSLAAAWAAAAAARAAPPRARTGAAGCLLGVAAVGFGQALMAKGYLLSAYGYGGFSGALLAVAAGLLAAPSAGSPGCPESSESSESSGTFESSGRKRTDALRCACAGAVLLVGLQQFHAMNALWMASEYDSRPDRDQTMYWAHEMKSYASLDAELRFAAALREAEVSAGTPRSRARILFSEEDLATRSDWSRWSGHGTHPQICGFCLVVSKGGVRSFRRGAEGAAEAEGIWRRVDGKFVQTDGKPTSSTPDTTPDHARGTNRIERNGP